MSKRQSSFHLDSEEEKTFRSAVMADRSTNSAWMRGQVALIMSDRNAWKRAVADAERLQARRGPKGERHLAFKGRAFSCVLETGHLARISSDAREAGLGGVKPILEGLATFGAERFLAARHPRNGDERPIPQPVAELIERLDRGRRASFDGDLPQAIGMATRMRGMIMQRATMRPGDRSAVERVHQFMPERLKNALQRIEGWTNVPAVAVLQACFMTAERAAAISERDRDAIVSI